MEELKANGDGNPILMYKPQGQIFSDTTFNLAKNDFCLAIQTKLQQEMFKKCANSHVVCVDSTHKTNGYDFPLITVLVADEFGEGYPVAWCISNREDKVVLIAFFEKLREKCGSIKASWLMTDMAEQYYSAWSTVFGPGTKKLLCTWHVDRAWRGQLKLIENKEIQATVYHNLRVLLEETECSTFELLLKATLKQLETHATTINFATYFKKYYEQNKKEWASCYRRNAGINTNMYIESFHRVLKHVYLRGKVNRRMDKCLHTLLIYARDKAFDRLIKLHKGKVSNRLTIIASRHKESSRVQEKDITALKDNMWKVASVSSERNYYVVKETDVCPIQCCMRCTECDICIHTYTCTCPDALIRHTICKHAHAVVRFDKAINHSSQAKSDSQDHILSCKQELICSTFATVKQQRNEFKSERDSIVEKLTILTAQIQQCRSKVACTSGCKNTHKLCK